MLCLLGTNVRAENKSGTGPRHKDAHANQPAASRQRQQRAGGNCQNPWGASGQCQGEQAVLEGAARGSLKDRTCRGKSGPNSLHVAWRLWFANPSEMGLGDPSPCPHGGHLAMLLPGHAAWVVACSPPDAFGCAGLVAWGHGTTGAGCQQDDESGERWAHHPGHPLVCPDLSPHHPRVQPHQQPFGLEEVEGDKVTFSGASSTPPQQWRGRASPLLSWTLLPRG